MYVYPVDIAGEAAGEREWEAASAEATRRGEAAAEAPGPSYLIANVFDGVVHPEARPPRPHEPGTADGFADPAASTYAWDDSGRRAPTIDPNYARIIARCAPRTPVLGYVSTRYGARPLGRPGTVDPTTVLGQVRLWRWLYPAIGGVFLDEVSSSPDDGQGDYYETVTAAVDGKVVANLGTPPPTDWLLARQIADTLVVFENTAAAFDRFAMPAWAAAHPPSAFAAIAHGATSPDDVRRIRRRSSAMDIGALYVTDRTMADGNPYRGLPSPPFWRALLAPL
jgi:hypothetical protein